MFLAGGEHRIQGRDQFRIVEFSRYAHFQTQVVGAHEQHVDAGHGRNTLGVFHCERGFDHDHYQRRGVHLAHCVRCRHRRKSELRVATCDGTVAGGREAQRIDYCPGFIRRIDMRHHDAQRPAIQAAGRQLQVHVRHAHNRRDPGIQRRNRDRTGGLHRRRSVFKIDEQKIETGGFHDFRDFDTAYCPHTDTGRHFARDQGAFRRVVDRMHVLSLKTENVKGELGL